MGWTNSHLHHFRVGKTLYGDPELMADNFEELGYEDSTVTKLSDIVPEGKKFRFAYEYDFGDCWEHEVSVEALWRMPIGLKSAVCLDGENACPPEDSGGAGGYEDLLRVLDDPSHEDHEHLRGWVGGPFDPHELDLALVNARLQAVR